MVLWFSKFSLNSGSAQKRGEKNTKEKKKERKKQEKGKKKRMKERRKESKKERGESPVFLFAIFRGAKRDTREESRVSHIKLILILSLSVEESSILF